eukprot:365878-Chlamydomonas_euryale.AAC.3
MLAGRASGGVTSRGVWRAGGVRLFRGVGGGALGSAEQLQHVHHPRQGPTSCVQRPVRRDTGKVVSWTLWETPPLAPGKSRLSRPVKLGGKQRRNV